MATDSLHDVKQAVITAVYRRDRPSLGAIVSFIRENRNELSVREQDANEKTISYVLVILQRDQVIQRHIGRSGDFYTIDPIHAESARRVSAGFNIHEVRLDDALKCLDADYADPVDDAIVTQSVLLSPPVIPVVVAGNDAPPSGCTIV